MTGTRVLITAALLALYISASAAGLLLMKQAVGLLTARFITGFSLYALGFGLWYLLLTRLPLSVAFPLAAGLLMIATQICGRYFLAERLSNVHLAGLGLILIGLSVIFFEHVRS